MTTPDDVADAKRILREITEGGSQSLNIIDLASAVCMLSTMNKRRIAELEAERDGLKSKIFRYEQALAYVVGDVAGAPIDLSAKAQRVADDLREENAALWEDVDQYIETVAKGQKERRELREAARWRKWPEEKPERNSSLLIVGPGYSCTGYHDGCNFHTRDGRLGYQVTHWRPIDQPKEEGK